MRRKIIVIEGALVIAITIALSFTATHTKENRVADAEEAAALVSVKDGVTAGVAETFQNIELQTAEELDVLVSIEAGEAEHVAATMEETDNAELSADTEPEDEISGGTELLAADGIAEDTEAVEIVEADTALEAAEAGTTPEAAEAASDKETVAVVQPALTEEEQEWLDYLMPNVNKSLNVRKAASEDADIVGKLYKGDRATVVEAGEEWTKITSGNVEGYVKNSLCFFGLDALAYAKENCDTVAKSTINGLRVRKEADLDGAVAGKIDKGTKLTVDKDAAAVEGWVAVRYKNNTCYVSADYVTLSMNIGKGVTLEEERKAQEEAKSSSKSSKKKSDRKPCALASEVDEVTLLACIIECEAGGQDYEALLAVGAVVMNRVKSSHYPDTIYDVIHQKGQFPPATSGKLEKWLKKGPTKKAVKAAKAAMAGDDNTGGKMSFQMVTTGRSGLVIGDNVFY